MNPQTTQVQLQPAGQPAISTGSMLTQVSSVLAVIILLILACAWLAKRLGFAPKHGLRGQTSLNISATRQVGQRERVVIIDVEDARLVLGVTAQQITHLHTLPPAPKQDTPEPPAAAADFRQLLQTLIKRPGKPQ
uniref:flagellar biosynthetic protein FliO n=1 Tax=Pantoea sp. IMH TaxID=1267600 RepID=UPI000469D5E5|nr:flagellar biosynthetic protein FliO [Pantoea sp. IMH]